MPDQDQIGDAPFSHSAIRYLEARSKLQVVQAMLHDAEAEFHQAKCRVREFLDRGDYKGRAAGSRGVAVSRGHAWFAGQGDVEVFPIDLLG